MKPGIFRDNNKLESLRGFAAIFVVMQHIVLDRIDVKFDSPVLHAFKAPGNLCVLVFFMLSGYVIGISNKSRLTSATVLTYLKKRIVRIYPIYFISLVLALLVSVGSYSLYIIVCNFAMLQNLCSIVVRENGPLWSLHYEFLYYLLFIPISYFNIRPLWVFIGCIILSFANYFLYPQLNAPIITAYTIGFSFWILGYIIAKNFITKEEEARPRILVSYIFLLLAMGVYHIHSIIYANLSTRIFKHPLDFPQSIYWGEVKVGFADLFFMPYCFIYIIVFANIKFRYKKACMLFFHLFPLLSLLTIYKMYNDQNRYEIMLCSVYYLLSLTFFFADFSLLDKVGRLIVKMGDWLGSISYGIYVIHFPILYLFAKIIWFPGSVIAYIIKLIVYSAVVIIVSYLLEKRFQTWVKKSLFKQTSP